MATFIIIPICLGLVFIVLGIIIPRYPQLLSGYSALSKDDRQSAKGIKAIRMIGLSTIAGGFIIIISNLVYHIMKWSSGLDYIVMGTILLIVCCYFYLLNKISTNKKANKISISLFVLLTIIITSGIIYSSNDANISIEKQEIKISGLYGKTIHFDEIAQIELVGNIPPIKYRSNGFSFGSSKKGYFKTNNDETVTLFLSTREGPYLCITEKSGARTFINNKNAENIINTYRKIAGTK
ncbi:MAG: hypothetical protein LBV74_19985 [Tannerella sp.]|jgi:hypothetical protein|nr:hypothetical protein [Tannerella sp.]